MKSSLPRYLLVTSLALTLSLNASADYAPAPQFDASTFKNARRLSEQDIEKILNLRTIKGDQFFRGFRQKGKKAADPKAHWATLDPKESLAQGTATETVYKTFPKTIRKNRGGDVIVAVIDSGVDIKHEALQGHIWVNEKEASGTPGVDDDKNGYIDDINGWNFVGGRDAQGNYTNIDGTTLEMTREVRRLEALKAQRELTASEAALLARVTQQVSDGLEEGRAGQRQYAPFASAVTLLEGYGLDINLPLAQALNTVTVPADDQAAVMAKELLADISGNPKLTGDRLLGVFDYYDSGVKYYYNTSFDHLSVIGDQSDDPSVDTNIAYGNNDVIGPDPSHGTHVSGIIGALRDKGFAVQGQAKNVKIMSIRAVPNGDERDKDVANAIRYAVNNGAKVVNMSFGKAYSPYKAYVDAAVKYAKSKGVLLVHAAGNDAKNLTDTSNPDNSNFPTPVLLSGERASNWIEVGASNTFANPALFTDLSMSAAQKSLPAEFSNYGSTSVDLFAPGKSIISSYPSRPLGKNESTYKHAQGTSMACPEVAGVAALLWNIFPQAGMSQIRGAMLKTTTQYPGLKVILPGTANEEVLFSSLSIHGGIVNASKAAAVLQKHFR